MKKLTNVWAASSRSGATECLEARTLDGETVHVRDSKNPDGGILTFSEQAWAQFVTAVREGEFRP